MYRCIGSAANCICRISLQLVIMAWPAFSQTLVSFTYYPLKYKCDNWGEKRGEITLYEHTIMQINMLRGHSVYMPLHIYKVHLGDGIHYVIKLKASLQVAVIPAVLMVAFTFTTLILLKMLCPWIKCFLDEDNRRWLVETAVLRELVKR